MNKTKPTPPITKMDHKKDIMHAGHRPEAYTNTHDGQIISMIGNTLVTRCREGKEHTYTVAPDAKVTSDGTACTTDDLQPGERIRLTTKPNDKHTATRLESLKANDEFTKS